MHILMPKLNCLIASSFEPLKQFLKENSFSSILIIADHHVFSLHGEPLIKLLDGMGQALVEPMLIPAGELSKDLATAENCWTHMHAVGMDRESLVIGLGGGVVTDLAGFVASCYMRGIATVYIPTTLMGMVDAAIGGKTAVNLPTAKNLIGTFYHPRLVLMIFYYLSTLPQREFRSGLAEAIKYGVIWDEQLFEYLEAHIGEILKGDIHHLNHIIDRSCAIKAEVVQSDERESGLRAILNWGHTFAHALETITNYSTYLHGEAVAIGMCCAALTSREMGFVDDRFVKRQIDLCMSAGLPTKLPSLDLDQLITLMAGDKKAVGSKISLVVAHGIGKVSVVKDVDPALIKKALLSNFQAAF